MAWKLVLQTAVISSFVKFVPHLMNKNSTHCILSSANWQKNRNRQRNIYCHLVLSKQNGLKPCPKKVNRYSASHGSQNQALTLLPS